MPTYPPMPWAVNLEDSLVASIHALDTERVAPLIPAPFQIVPCWPGKTLGGLYYAHYGPGSSLEYHELIVVAALTRLGARLCPWVSHLFVDDPDSVAGGRALLGVPKVLATFAVSPGDPTTIEVTSGGVPIAHLEARKHGLALPFRATSWSANRDVRDPTGRLAVVFGSELHGRAAFTRPHVTIPPESPLAELELGRALAGLWAPHAAGSLGGIPGQEAELITLR